METRSIYEYQSYKQFMKDRIERIRRPGLMTDLAASIGCDRTYLSQVLSGKAHLTMDQAINLGEVFNLSETEGDFFLLLVMKDRSSQASAKKKFDRKITVLREEHLAISKRLKSTDVAELSEDLKIRYYSSWRYSAAHILTSIPRLQKARAMAATLDLSERETLKLLEELVQMRLVSQQGDRFVHSGGNFHVPADSPLVGFNHVNWRMKALEEVRGPVGVHYTNVFSISAEDAAVLKSQLLSFIESQRRNIAKSGTDEAHVFCCDFFPVNGHEDRVV